MKPVMVLIVLDGWGIGNHDASNPMRQAKMPTFDWLREHFPMTSLQASGISVGLPWGETSNSEVGHLTIGAGKVIYQYYPRIILGIRDQSFFANEALLGACEHARKNNSAVNLMGLLT
ncbi:MAG: 2,3-bisphosphoglycerate-independent phosphoglycerate mutase, partial [Patescibacteria group bacterium]